MEPRTEMTPIAFSLVLTGVLLNAAAALSTECGDWKAGLAEASESIDSGAALDALERFIEKTRSFVTQ